MKTLKQVTRVGSQSSGIGTNQGKFDYQSPSHWLFYQVHSVFPLQAFWRKMRKLGLSLLNHFPTFRKDEKVIFLPFMPFSSSHPSFSLPPPHFLSSHFVLPIGPLTSKGPGLVAVCSASKVYMSTKSKNSHLLHRP